MMAASLVRSIVCQNSMNNVRNKLRNFLDLPQLAHTECKGQLLRSCHANKPISYVQRAFLRTNIKNNFGQPLNQEEVKDTREEDSKYVKETIAMVNDQIVKEEEGRLFAVIHVAGKQFIVTQEDIIIIHGPWPPSISDKIQFEKVLLVGASDFSLIGRPILPPELVSVKGTVIDKDLSHIKTKFRFRKRKQFRRINFIRSPLTMIRINEVKIVGKVGERKEVEGLNQVFY